MKPTLIRFAIAALLLLATHTLLYAQHENDNWYFGYRSALNFSSGDPMSNINSEMSAPAGCATISDKTTGNLILYTNGQNIWNGNNNVMPNGSGLMGGTNATQAALLVSYPLQSGKYVVFTTGSAADSGGMGLRYSVVDTALDSNRGDVVVAEKNILLYPAASERLTAAPDRYGFNYWVMTHARGTDEFVAFKLTSSGVDPIPVISRVGMVHNTSAIRDTDATIGQMKFSRNFKMLAVALYGQNKIQIFKFNNVTGVVSDPITIATPDHPYGLEFSKLGNKLYYTLARGVYQLDLNLPLDDLQLSVMPIGYSNEGYPFGDLQIATDEHIYVAVNNANWLSVITDPPKLGVACGFVDTAVFIASPTVYSPVSHVGLPQIFVPLLYGIGIPVWDDYVIADTCNSDPISFAFNNIHNVTYVEWDFGEPDNPDNTAIGTAVTHQYFTAGRYRVTTIIHTEYFNDTIARYINVITCKEDGDAIVADCKMYVPNAFTPHGYYNTTFRPIVTCPAESYNFHVYNRWGEVVYQTDQPSGRWDGNYKGMPCEMGTYFYMVTYKFYGKDEKRHVGDVTLIR